MSKTHPGGGYRAIRGETRDYLKALNYTFRTYSGQRSGNISTPVHEAVRNEKKKEKKK